MKEHIPDHEQLRNALEQEAMEEYRQALADFAEELPSAAYFQWEQDFLKNPATARKRPRPLWRKLAQRTACALLAVGLSVTLAVGTSAQIQDALFHLFTVDHDTHTDFMVSGPHLPPEALRHWYPAYLPEGYQETEVIDLGNLVSRLYNNDDPEMEIELSYQLLSPGGGESLDNERHVITEIMIHDMPGYLLTATDGSQNMLVWADMVHNHMFLLMSRVPCDTLIQIAENVKMME